jgi:hypothetical protein
MTNTSLRKRVHRLLSDDFHVDDITTLFMALRERSHGREAFVEIRDYVAHRDERNRGIITRATRDTFQVLRHGYLKLPIDLSNLPVDFGVTLRAAFRRIDNTKLKADTGLKRNRAERVKEAIIDKIVTDASGKSVLPSVTQEEQAVLQCLLRHFSSLAAFDERRLFEEFRDTLVANNLLEPKELRLFEKLQSRLALYAVAHMHQCVVDLGDGTKAVLSASANCGSGTICIYAGATVTIPSGAEVTMNIPIFTTNQVAERCCEPSLLVNPMPAWSCPLEITRRGTLAEVGTIIHDHPNQESLRACRLRALKRGLPFLRRAPNSK